jgi:hypothetical protein
MTKIRLCNILCNLKQYCRPSLFKICYIEGAGPNHSPRSPFSLGRYLCMYYIVKDPPPLPHTDRVIVRGEDPHIEILSYRIPLQISSWYCHGEYICSYTCSTLTANFIKKPVSRTSYRKIRSMLRCQSCK